MVNNRIIIVYQYLLFIINQRQKRQNIEHMKKILGIYVLLSLILFNPNQFTGFYIRIKWMKY